MKSADAAIREAISALRYLAKHERPVGGESLFNSAHLEQLAQQLVPVQYEVGFVVQLPKGLAKNIKDDGYYRGVCDMMDCVRAAGSKMVGDE
ncbi:hypothetical protein [Acinetobacter phage ABPH49]|nr:hypothetical protein [Acinetobacter phage ABPH49]